MRLHVWIVGVVLCCCVHRTEERSIVPPGYARRRGNSTRVLQLSTGGGTWGGPQVWSESCGDLKPNATHRARSSTGIGAVRAFAHGADSGGPVPFGHFPAQAARKRRNQLRRKTRHQMRQLSWNPSSVGGTRANPWTTHAPDLRPFRTIPSDRPPNNTSLSRATAVLKCQGLPHRRLFATRVCCTCLQSFQKACN